MKRRGKGHVYTGVYLAVQDEFKNCENITGKVLYGFFFFFLVIIIQRLRLNTILLRHYEFSVGGEEQCSITGSQLVFSYSYENLPKQKVVMGKQLQRTTV